MKTRLCLAGMNAFVFLYFFFLDILGYAEFSMQNYSSNILNDVATVSHYFFNFKLCMETSLYMYVCVAKLFIIANSLNLS